ncbi:MAG: replication-associated recombination protein A, partial [Candidatus Glassbacteria bacterium]
QFVGLPECELNLANAVIYLALAPKSNSVLRALKAAKEAALETTAEPVPLHLRNAPTGLMKRLGYGKGYKYPHDYPGHIANEDYLPEKLRERKFYTPDGQGLEKELERRLAEIERRRKGKKKGG